MGAVRHRRLIRLAVARRRPRNGRRRRGGGGSAVTGHRGTTQFAGSTVSGWRRRTAYSPAANSIELARASARHRPPPWATSPATRQAETATTAAPSRPPAPALTTSSTAARGTTPTTTTPPGITDATRGPGGTSTSSKPSSRRRTAGDVGDRAKTSAQRGKLGRPGRRHVVDGMQDPIKEGRADIVRTGSSTSPARSHYGVQSTAERPEQGRALGRRPTASSPGRSTQRATRPRTSTSTSFSTPGSSVVTSHAAASPR